MDKNSKQQVRLLMNIKTPNHKYKEGEVFNLIRHEGKFIWVQSLLSGLTLCLPAKLFSESIYFSN